VEINVSAHDKHSRMRKLQSFLFFMAAKLTHQYIPASNSYVQFVLKMFASCFHACPSSTAPVSDDGVDDRLIQPLPFFNYTLSRNSSIIN